MTCLLSAAMAGTPAGKAASAAAPPSAVRRLIMNVFDMKTSCNFS
jgi:hypothetical protein